MKYIHNLYKKLKEQRDDFTNKIDHIQYTQATEMNNWSKLYIDP